MQLAETGRDASRGTQVALVPEAPERVLEVRTSVIETVIRVEEAGEQLMGKRQVVFAGRTGERVESGDQIATVHRIDARYQ
jgi:hypothetical protein